MYWGHRHHHIEQVEIVEIATYDGDMANAAQGFYCHDCIYFEYPHVHVVLSIELSNDVDEVRMCEIREVDRYNKENNVHIGILFNFP